VTQKKENVRCWKPIPNNGIKVVILDSGVGVCVCVRVCSCVVAFAPEQSSRALCQTVAILHFLHTGEVLRVVAALNSSTHSVYMSALVLGPVRAVTECFRTARILAGIRPLPCVRSLMNLQVFKPGERFGASLKL
jgi:hypothetical protein